MKKSKKKKTMKKKFKKFIYVRFDGVYKIFFDEKETQNKKFF